MATPGTLLLIHRCLLQHNANLENHSRLHLAGELRGVDDLAVSSTHHLIVTLLDEAVSQAIFAIAIDDIIKILVCRDL